MEFAFQGQQTQRHKLAPHGRDRFSWLLSERESAELGRWPDLDPEIYLFRFEGTGDCADEITGLRWVHDPDVPEGEVFGRRTLAG